MEMLSKTICEYISGQSSARGFKILPSSGMEYIIRHISFEKAKKKTAAAQEVAAVKHILLLTVASAMLLFEYVRCFETAGIMLTETAPSTEEGKCTRGITIPVRLPYWLNASVLFGYIESLSGISMFSTAVKNDDAALDAERGRAIDAIFLKHDDMLMLRLFLLYCFLSVEINKNAAVSRNENVSPSTTPTIAAEHALSIVSGE